MNERNFQPPSPGSERACDPHSETLSKEDSRELRRQTKELLRELGPAPGFIAERLGRLGVRGSMGDPNEGAVAALLGSLVGTHRSVTSVRLTPRTVRLDVIGRRRPLLILLPLPVRNFMIAFEYASYPELLRPSSVPRPPTPPSAGSDATSLPKDAAKRPEHS